MGRAIVRNPKVFLFDEPLSNLDAKLRVQMRTEIKRVHQKVKTTTVYVTHDQVEAMTLADRVVVMNSGRIEQIGTPHELYHHPRTRFVAGFIGSPAMNFMPCRLEQSARPSHARFGSIALPVPATARPLPVCRRQGAGLRPAAGAHHRAAPQWPRRWLRFRCHPDVVEPMGMETMVFFTVNGTEFCSRVDPAARPSRGQNAAHANVDHMHLIDPASGAVI